MMTRKEILLDIAKRCGIDIDGSEYVMTYNRDKMIKFKRWLFKELKNADKEPCEDVVSRANLMRKFEDRFIELQKAHQKDMQLGVNWCINTLKDLPSVTPTTPTRKKGHWIMINNYLTAAYETIDYVKCSYCGEESLEEGDYCPNCGSFMKGEFE